MNNTLPTEAAKSHLEKILSIMAIEATVNEEPFDESTTCFRIACNDDDAKNLIGRRGQTLEALQFLLRQMSRNIEGDEAHFVVDVLDYRERRKQAILGQAKTAAVAVLNGEYEEYSLPTMNAFERRIAHNYLHENFPELASHSAGRGPERHIIVNYAGLPVEGESEDGPQEASEEAPEAVAAESNEETQEG